MTVKAEHMGGDRWRVRVYAGRDLLGRPRQRSRHFRANGQREANRVAASYEHQLREELKYRRHRRSTLNGLIDEWQTIRDAKDSPSTVRARRTAVRRIREAMGHVVLADLNARHVDQWLAELSADGLSDTTVANHWSLLRAILRQGERWDQCTARATTKASPPRRTPNRRPAPPTTQAVAVLIDTARPTLRIAAMLAAYAGLRRGEVVALEWSDIDWAGRRVHVRRAHVELDGGGWAVKAPKSGVDRWVTVDVDLLAELAAYRELTTGVDGPVLRDMISGAGRRPGWVTLAWRRHVRRQGAPGVRFHDLRHYFATDALDTGWALPQVQEQLGHLQLTTTANVYGHAVDAGKAALAEAQRQRRHNLGG